MSNPEVPTLASSTVAKKYTCPIEGCPKGYTRPSLLAEHMRSHENSRPFACEQCGKKFLRESHLKSHRWLHAEEKPLGCTECDKRFITNQQLQRHLQTHERKRARAEKKKSQLESTAVGYTWKMRDGERIRHYSTASSDSPSSFTNSISGTDTDSPATTVSNTGASITDIAEPLPELLTCPYNCRGVFDNTKTLSDHILQGHVFTDTIDVDTHLNSIKHDLDGTTSPYAMDRLTDWDGLDWSEKHCMEVRCQGPCPSYTDFESLIAHYNDDHGFIPDSLFEYVGSEAVDGK